MSRRLSVNINDETADALTAAAAARGVSLTEAVRRAVAVYKLIEDEVERGRAIHLVSDTGEVTEVRLL